MKSIRDYFPNGLRKWVRKSPKKIGDRMWQTIRPSIERLSAVKSSLRFDAKEFSAQHFVRYAYYSELKRWVGDGVFPSNYRARVIEFGASNNVITRMFNDVDYIVAPNWPEVDIQNLRQYSSESFDVVVIDQILEHVANPNQAASEIWRVLKVGGVCFCTTPFLIQIHGSYGDYWRFTDLGIKRVFAQFSAVSVYSWGNRFTLETTIRSGWLSCRETRRRLRVALWNEPDWPLVYLTKAVK